MLVGGERDGAVRLGTNIILYTKEQFVKIAALAALVGLSIGSSQIQAADFGIGVSVQSDDSIIYAPIDINKKFRIEPSIRYLKNETDIGIGTDVESESLELAVGLFGLTEPTESIRVYFGGRVAYIKQESDQIILPVSSAPLYERCRP